MTNFSFFIGCDISKAVIDVSCWIDNKPTYLGQFANDEHGFISILNLLRSKTQIDLDQWFFLFENTGAYSKLFLIWLLDNDIKCLEENPLRISRSLGMRRGKSDKIDSLDLCRYVFEKRDSLKPSSALCPKLVKLKTLLSRRDFLVKQQTAMKVSLKEKKAYLEEDLFQELNTGNQELIDHFNKQIKAIDRKIELLLKEDQSLDNTYKLIRSVVGIGPVTAAYLIATTNNFKSINSARKYASYCGIAPFPNSSGIRTGRRKVSHMANKKMKALLSNCILSAIKHDPQIGMYYLRKKEEGKRSGVILNAIKNKLVQRVFAVVKRQTPYVKLQHL